MRYDVHCSGLNELRRELEKAGDVPPEVRKEMAAEMADVTEKSLIYFSATMLQGPYYEGDVARSVKAQKPRATKGGATCQVKFEGEAHGNRVAEIAFINQFGKKSQPPRQFITRSEKESGNPAAEKASEVLDKWLKQNRL